MSRGLAIPCALLLACGGQIMPALGPASDVEDTAEQACAAGDLFADVPVEALIREDELWVRGAGGTLASLRLTGQKSAIVYHIDHERVVDVHLSSKDALWALTVADAPGDMRIWQRTNGGWTPLWEMGAPSDAMGLVELGGWPAVVTPQRIYVATGELWTQELQPPLPEVTHYQTVANGSSLWITARGVGWLYHVDAETGKSRGVADVQAEPCSGLLDPSCDVISDLDVDPLRPGCALVTSRGRVLRACRDEPIELARGVRRALRAEWAEQIRALALLYPEGSASRLHLLSLIVAENPMSLARHNLAEHLPKLDSDPIEAVAATNEGYLALGSLALYRIDGRNNRRNELPKGIDRCGLEVTRTNAAVIVNASQPLPLLASLQKLAPLKQATLAAPSPPCTDTVIYYGQSDGVTAVMSCVNGEVTMMERAVPNDRHFAVSPLAWRQLWADLERAQWRSWKSCDPVENRDATHDRFMISTPAHTLQVDCSRDSLNNHQRAVLERLQKIVESSRARE